MMSMKEMWESVISGADIDLFTEDQIYQFKLFYYSGASFALHANDHYQRNSESKDMYVKSMDDLKHECIEFGVAQRYEDDNNVIKKPILKIVK